VSVQSRFSFWLTPIDKGGSSHSGRRSFASNLLAKGHDLETVQQLLGHAELDHVMPYLEVLSEKLREMFSVVV